MAARTTARSVEPTIEIEPVKQRTIEIAVVGTRPLICNRMSEKARRELLMPAGRKTAADKLANLKHNPVEEFRASPYILPDGPTAIGLMSTAFKGAMMTAALDLPGAKKTQIGRLVFVEDDYVPVYGEPQLFMSITRSADMNRTPDVRTRAILPRWAALLRVTFVVPLINEKSVVNLLVAGGVTAGVGDFRTEKGHGNYGQFRVTDQTDAEFVEIAGNGGRNVQEASLDNPQCYDSETAELLSWFVTEADRRGRLVAA